MKQYMGWPVDFTRPAGEPAYAAPGSITWRVFANPVAMAIGGVCAVLLEFADPRIRSGVWEHSTFARDPVGRARRTGMAAYIGAFGPRSAADQVIAGINRMHGRVEGRTPEGRRYRALEPELLDWVAATATYGFVMAYHRFVHPLTSTEIDRFFEEAVPIGRLYGAEGLPVGRADFERLCEDRAGEFEAHPINLEFLHIICSGAAVRGVPHWLRRAFAHAAVSLLPPVVRTALNLGHEFDLSHRQTAVIGAIGRLADVVPQPYTPAAQASRRLGLPWWFPWRSQTTQQRLLAGRLSSDTSG